MITQSDGPTSLVKKAAEAAPPPPFLKEEVHKDPRGTVQQLPLPAAPFIFLTQSSQAFNQSQIKLELGREIPFICLQQESESGIEMLSSPQLSQIFDAAKIKFVLSFDGSSMGESSGISIFQQPICYDDSQCSYYLLKCTLRPGASPPLKLVMLGYVLADFCCLEASDQRVMQALDRSLVRIRPSWNKFNCLLVHAFDEQASYGESTTAYETNSFPNGTAGEDHFSQFSATRGMASPKQQLKSSQSQRMTLHSESLKLFNKHFNRVVRVVQPFSSLFKTASHCKQYLMKGVSFTRGTILSLIERVNGDPEIDLSRIQLQLLKQNMKHAIAACRESYSQLVKTMFLEGQSLSYENLTSNLGEIYQQTISAFDREFEGFSCLEQYGIYRAMIKRFVEEQEAHIQALNDFIHENECAEALQSTIDKTKLFEFFQQSFIDTQNSRSAGLSIDALKTFLGEQYALEMHQEIQAMVNKNEKVVMQTLNYSQNPVETLRYFEQRVENSRIKKKRLEDCLRIAERELDISENLNNGYSLALTQGRLQLQSLQRRESGPARLPA